MGLRQVDASVSKLEHVRHGPLARRQPGLAHRASDPHDTAGRVTTRKGVFVVASVVMHDATVRASYARLGHVRGITMRRTGVSFASTCELSLGAFDAEAAD